MGSEAEGSDHCGDVELLSPRQVKLAHYRAEEELFAERFKAAERALRDLYKETAEAKTVRRGEGKGARSRSE